MKNTDWSMLIAIIIEAFVLILVFYLIYKGLG